MAYIGLDLGSSYTKIALMEGGHVLSEQQLPTPTPFEFSKLRYEIDADTYFAQIFTLLQAYTARGKDGIFISTQMHGYVLSDETFKPITPYISWQDKLGEIHLPQIAHLLNKFDLATSGVPLKGNLALCSLLARILNGYIIPKGTLFNSLGGYVIGRLTGKHVCHITNAAPTGLVDVLQGCWNTNLIKDSGLSVLKFPKIVHDIKPIGIWGNSSVHPDFGDQQVCAFGAELLPEKSLHINIGTAGLIGCLTPNWQQGNFENRPWIQPGSFLRTISGLPGGRHVEIFKKNLESALHESNIFINNSNMWHFMSSLDMSLLGNTVPILFGQSSVDTIVRNFYHSIIERYSKAAEQLHLQIGHLRFSGGCIVKNNVLRDMFADKFRVEYCTDDFNVMKGILSIIAQYEVNYL